MSIRLITGLVALVLMYASMTPYGKAEERIGQIKVVSGDAIVVRDGAESPAEAGTPLFEGDVIRTGDNSAVGMTFTDNSRLSMGPNSELSIENYAYSRPGRQNSFDARLKSGSLTASSGQIAKSRPLAMRILMPTTVLGVKGTTIAAPCRWRQVRRLGLLALVFLAGCTATERDQGWFDGNAWSVESAAALPAPDDPYLAALREGYLALAETELADYDWNSAAEFRARAVRAAAGEAVAPTDPATLRLGGAGDGVEAAYKEITGYIASEGAMLRAARQIGDAQVKYDCWVEQAYEGHQSADIMACREAYELLIVLIRDLAQLPDNMAVVLPEDEGGEIGGIELTQGGKTITLDQPFAAAATGEKFGDLPVSQGEIRDAFAGALAARPKPPKEFVITFDFNSTRVTDKAFEGVLLAAEEARSRPAAEVIVTGFADAVGDSATNQAISERRAQIVADAIFNELRDEETVTFLRGGKGERDLAVDKAGREEANRRVIILVR